MNSKGYLIAVVCIPPKTIVVGWVESCRGGTQTTALHCHLIMRGAPQLHFLGKTRREI